MRSFTEADWNFFAYLAPLEEMARLASKSKAEVRKRANNELMRMCVWEYARECAPLCSAISGLRDEVGNLLQLATSQKSAVRTLEVIRAKKIPLMPGDPRIRTLPGTKAFRALPKEIQKRARAYHDFSQKFAVRLEDIEKMVGRFDWHFLCGTEFPDKAWLELSPDGETRASGTLFPPRSEELGRSPVVSRMSGDCAEYFNGRNRMVLDELERFFVKLMAEQYELGSAGFECWVIPDQVFEIFEPEQIAASLQRLCLQRDPHRLVLSDPTNDKFKRESPATYLRWLAVMRFFHFYDRAGRKEQLERLQDSKASRDKDALQILRPLVEGGGARDGEARKDATEFYRKLFKQPSDTKPISYGRSPRNPAGS
jgi:hypothetical protein